MRDIFSELIGDLDKDSAKSPPQTEDEQSLALPEGAKPYLPAHVWEKITQTQTPRRGIILNALERLRSVLYLISTYLPQHIVQQKMRRPICGQFQGQLVSGTLLFSDVSGFTALSERLAVLGNEGAEQLTQIMNGYFENMLEILSWSGGILLKFAGDATLVYFVEQEGNEQAQWAVRTAQRMMAAMTQFQDIETPLGSVGLKMKIGISTGHFLEAHIGSSERMEYVVIGRTVNQTMTAEGTAEAGMIVVDKATAEQLAPAHYAPHVPGYFVVDTGIQEKIDDFEVKAESRRARGSVPWNANPHAIAAQMDVAVRQINALTPYLAQELIDSIVTNAKKRRIASEFRPTTIIFCNFIGFETFLDLWGDLGPRRVAKMLSQFFEAAQQIIADYGGVITRIDPYSYGSKMLILFGAPKAHEDDPQRAASAAIAMQAKVGELNQKWQKRYQRQLSELDEELKANSQVQLKIGITHGRTFAGQVGAATRREYTVMGDDVNLSARLMSAAKPGQILLNEPVYTKIEAHFDTNKLDPIRVKGKSEPIQIFELKAKKAALTAQSIEDQKPIFGRFQELTLSQNIVRQLAQGQGQYLQITGPAGIGKSHILSTFYNEAQQGTVKTLLNYCHSFTAQSPYAIWINFIRTLSAMNDNDSLDSASEKLSVLLKRLEMMEEEYSRPLANLLNLRIKTASASTNTATLADTSPPAKPAGGSSLFSQLGQKMAAQEDRPRPALDLSRVTDKQPSNKPAQLWQRLQIQVASREKARLFTSILHLLTQLARQQPLLLLFENAQWLDPASQELLNDIGPKLQNIPLLILSIHRDLPDLSKSSDEKTVQNMNLGPLTLEATAEFTNHLLEKKQEQEIIQAIHTQSSGNPLYIREMVYWLQRNQENNQTKNLTDSLMTSITIQELILSRIDNLPLSARETLKTAAIIGNEFELPALEALLQEQKNEYDTSVALKHLTADQLISETNSGSDPTNGRRYSFQQPLVREIIYNSQSFAKRRQSHHFIATYLEERYRANIGQQAELLAYHFEQAEAWPKAGQYIFLAAQGARQRFAYPLASVTYGRALVVLTKLPAAERTSEVRALMVQCHLGQGDIALLLGEIPTAAFAYQSAIHLLTAGQLPIPPEIQIKLAQTLPVLGKEAEAEAILRSLLERPIFGQLLSTKNETAVAATLTWLLSRTESDERPRWLAQTRRLTEKRPNDAWAVGLLALLTEWEGNLEDALEAYQTFEQPAGIIIASCRLGDRFLNTGEFDMARKHYQQALKAAADTNNADSAGFALALYRTAELDWRTGNPNQALDGLRSALDKLPYGFNLEQQTISQALILIEREDTAPWPPWHWRNYDDVFRISLLFNSEFDTQFPEITI